MLRSVGSVGSGPPIQIYVSASTHTKSHHYVQATPSPMLPLSPEDAEVVPLARPGLPADSGKGALDIGTGPLEQDVPAIDGGRDGADPDLDLGVEALALLHNAVHEPAA